MTNKKLLEKLQEDMEMRGFSHYTKDSYYRKAKEILEYFGKTMNQVTTKELREFLIKHIREEKKISEISEAVAETLEELAEDKKYLGAQIGFMEVLHTWGQRFEVKYNKIVNKDSKF